MVEFTFGTRGLGFDQDRIMFEGCKTKQKNIKYLQCMERYTSQVIYFNDQKM